MAEFNKLRNLKNVRAVSSNAVPGTNFSGTLEFKYSVPNGESAKPQRGYFTMALPLPKDLVKTSADNKSATNMGLINNLVGSIFDNAKFSLNNENTENIENWRVYQCMNKLMYSSVEAQKCDGSPMILYPGYYNDDRTQNAEGPSYRKGGATDYTVALSLVHKATDEINSKMLMNIDKSSAAVATYALYSESITNATNVNTHVLISFPFPFLNVVHPMDNDEDYENDDFIPGNTEMKVTFTVNTQLKESFIYGSDTALTPAELNVAKFNWFIPTYKDKIYENVDIKRRCYVTKTYRDNMTTRGTFTIPASSNIHKIGICVMKHIGLNKQSNIPYFPKTEAWNSFHIQYGSDKYPANTYVLNTSTVNTWGEAFLDYKMMCDAENVGETPVIPDLATYMTHPCWIFQTRLEPGSVLATNIEIDISRIAVVGNLETDLDICVYMESLGEYTIKYGDRGVVEATEFNRIG